MTIRTTNSSVEFRAPFKLGGHDEILPAGIYQIDTDEEVIEGIERTVYRRVATRMRIETLGKTAHRSVEPQQLEAALQRDRDAVLPPDQAGASSSPDEVEPAALAAVSRRSPFSSTFKTIRSWLEARRTGQAS